MINFLLCMIRGHKYETVSHTSHAPRFSKFNCSGYVPWSIEAGMVGYTKTVQICKRCGKVHITQSLGES